LYSDLSALAGLGQDGRYPNHCNHELQNKLKSCLPCPSLEAEMYLRNPSGGAVFTAPQSILLPHVWFSAVYNRYPTAFRQRICPSHSALLGFWRHMEDHPQMQGHPMRDRPNWRNWNIPISFHGDGVPVTGCGKVWSKTMNIYSWNSLVGNGSTTQFNFYIYGIWKHLISHGAALPTMRSFFTILSWSLKWLHRGLWPDTDWNNAPLTNPIDVARAGTPLAGKPGAFYFCTLWILRGDLEYLWQELGLPNINSNQPCCFCPANVATLPLYEFRLAVAQWLPRIYNVVQWRATGHATNELFNIAHAGINIHTVGPDLMHCKHLGVDQYFHGSVMWLLCFMIYPGGATENVERLFSELKAAYRTYSPSCKYNGLKMSMFCDGRNPPATHPKLKGRAAECRHLGKALLKVWTDNLDPTNAQHIQIRLALERSVESEEILDAHPTAVRFPTAIGDRYKDCLLTYLVLFNALGSHYSSAAGLGLKLFDVTVKAHYMAHIALLSVFMNPRLSWTYSGEDFMQHSKRLMAACARGVQPAMIAHKFLFHYRIAMHVMMSDEDPRLLK
jgi:hypothetical protein